MTLINDFKERIQKGKTHAMLKKLGVKKESMSDVLFDSIHKLRVEGAQITDVEDGKLLGNPNLRQTQLKDKKYGKDTNILFGNHGEIIISSIEIKEEEKSKIINIIGNEIEKSTAKIIERTINIKGSKVNSNAIKIKFGESELDIKEVIRNGTLDNGILKLDEDVSSGLQKVGDTRILDESTVGDVISLAKESLIKSQQKCIDIEESMDGKYTIDEEELKALEKDGVELL